MAVHVCNQRKKKKRRGATHILLLVQRFSFHVGRLCGRLASLMLPLASIELRH